MKRFVKLLALGLCAVLLSISFSTASFHTFSKALRYFRLSAPVSAQASPENTAAESLVEQGRQRYREGKYQEAIDLWKDAETSFADQEPLRQSMVRSNLALAYKQLGDWTQANQAISSSLALLQEFDTLDRQGLNILAQALNTQGSVQLTQGQTEAALVSWEQAEAVYAEAENTTGRARSLVNQAIALRILGFHRRAVEQLDRVTKLLEANSGDNSALQAALWRSLGETQRLIGDLDASEENLSKSLQTLGNNAPAQARAVTLLSFANTLQAQAEQQREFAGRTKQTGDYTNALERYQAALEHYDDAIALAPTALLQVQAKLNQFDIYRQLKAWEGEAALDQFDTYRQLKARGEVDWQIIQAQVASLPLSRAAIYARVKLAESLIALPTPCSLPNCPSEQDIYQLLTEGIDQARAIEDTRAESHALGVLGHLYEQESQQLPAQNRVAAQAARNNAKQITQEALSLAQASHAREVVYQWQWQLGRLYNSSPEDAMDKAIAAYGSAFEGIKTLRDDILFLDPEVQFRFRDRVEPLYREYVSLLLPPQDQESSLAEQAKSVQIEVAKEVIDDLRLAELENYLACSLVNPSDFGELEDIDKIINKDSHTAILYPIILGDRLEVLLQTPNKPIYRYPSQQIEQDIVQTTLEDLRDELEKPYFSSKHGKPVAAEVYDWLIRPAKARLSADGIQTLVFVLDGELRNVPMAALYDDRADKYLIEQFAIAATFGDLKLPKDEPSQRFRALAAGLSEIPQNEPEFGALIYVPVEIDNVSSVLSSLTTLSNEAFTSDAIAAEISTLPYNVVHLATHGEFGFSREQTFLLAAQSKDSSVETDQDLNNPDEPDEPRILVEQVSLDELDPLLRLRNQTPIELLVLSACETATGDDREVLGIAGMAVQAGARSTIATLWSIDDSSTATMMETFYQQLSTGTSTARALQQAQLQLLKSSAYKPSDWSPYLLVGDWR